MNLDYFWIPEIAANALQESLACQFVRNIVVLIHSKSRIPFLALCPAASLERFLSNRLLEVYLCGTVEEVQLGQLGIWWTDSFQLLVVFQRSLGFCGSASNCWDALWIDLRILSCQTARPSWESRAEWQKCFEIQEKLQRWWYLVFLSQKGWIFSPDILLISNVNVGFCWVEKIVFEYLCSGGDEWNMTF